MNRILVVISIVTFAASMYAQKNHENFDEKIESKKIAYISDKLNLSPKEAQIFWPLYNEYYAEMKNIRKSEYTKTDSKEVDHDDALLHLFDGEKERLELNEQYAIKFKQQIGAEKTLEFFNLERTFKKEMLSGFKERRERMSGERGNERRERGK